MSCTMYHASKAVLESDRKNIIREQCVDALEGTQSTKIQRARLKELCDKRVKALGLGLSYNPTSFSKDIKALSGDELTPDHLKHISIEDVYVAPGSPKYDRFIIPHIDRIKSYLQSIELSESSQNMEHKDITQVIFKSEYLDPTIWEDEWKRVMRYQIEEDKSLKTIIGLKRRKDHEFMVNAVADIESHTRPSRWRISTFFPDNAKFFFDRQSMKALNRLVELHLARNRFRFKFIIEYLGPFEERDYLEGEVFDRTKEKEIKYFFFWASAFHGITLTEEDKTAIRRYLSTPPNKLEERLVDSVDLKIVELLTKFQNTLKEYVQVAMKSNSLAPLGYD